VVVEQRPIPVHDQATRFSGKRGDKQDGKGNGLGVGEPGDPMNTLTAGDRHAVACLASGKETVGTLMANAGTKLWLGNQEAFSGDYHIVEERESPLQYLVRRLTPTECARLQGFADRWGDIDVKEDFTEEEYQFWLGVRKAHASIFKKIFKKYTKQQMLAWYNKLHTDSAEYKMWGNGIALPPALYVMQGIEDALKGT
jgi:site-specific DNA-cytosine methylase